MSGTCSGHTLSKATPPRSRTAGIKRASVDDNVDHAVLSMPLAVSRPRPALEIEAWLPSAQGMFATLVARVYHAVLSVFFAVQPHLFALDIECRTSRTRFPRTAWGEDVYHVRSSMSLAVSRRVATLYVENSAAPARIFGAENLADVNHVLSACCRQYAATSSPSTLKLGLVMHEPCEQRFVRTLTIPHSACSLL